MRWQASSVRRWSGSSTEFASRSIAAATKFASTRATSTRSARTRCPVSSTRRGVYPWSRWCSTVRAVDLPRPSRCVSGHRLPNRRRRPPEGVVTFLFDLLHVDGEDLLDTPLSERAARLAVLAPELRIPSVITADAEEAQHVLDESLRAGHEGVVVKDAASLYAAGRRGKAWRKVKPVRTYDLVVLGAEWGHGRRKGWLSNLHRRARSEHGRLRDGREVLQGLDRRASRLADEGVARARGGTPRIAVLSVPSSSSRLRSTASRRRLAMRAVALRFARVKRYRPDKDASEADTIDELRALLPVRSRAARPAGG